MLKPVYVEKIVVFLAMALICLTVAALSATAEQAGSSIRAETAALWMPP
ncbi:MAG: hypothetical protein HQL87_09380 [Magnetococcales bacterium]|nr:hypothetical protein [Magnetococcales bacterium]